YSEYLAPSDDDIAPAEDQPLPALPIALSPGYIADSKPIEDGLEEDPEMDPVDYVADEEEFEIGESSAVAAARQPELTLARGTKLNFMTALEEVKESVADMATRHRQDSEEFYTRHQDAQDDRALLRARSSTLARERRYYRHMAIVADREAIYARHA
ncbi:hypothetical protein Tco_0223509, partial [Tanacetum coccineum]